MLMLIRFGDYEHGARAVSVGKWAAAVFLLMGSVMFTDVLGQPSAYKSPHPEPNGGFGAAVAGVDDLDGDGAPDVLIGAPGEGGGTLENAGRAYVFGGKTGSLVHTLSAPNPTANEAFGRTVASVGDVTGDGISELAIGATGADRTGRVYLFDGRTGTVRRTYRSPAAMAGGLFGRSLAGIGDVNGDSIPDLAVGAIGEGEDRVYVFGGTGGDLLYTLQSSTEGHDHFGKVAGLDDIDGDDVPDLLVGASTTTVGNRSAAGRAYLYNGRTGDQIRSLRPPSRTGGHFGYLIAVPGDVSGDNVSDVIVGAVGQGHEAGQLFVYDGSDGTVLYHVEPPPPGDDGYRGYSICPVGSVAGTEGADLVLGTRVPATDSVQSGRVYLYDGQTGRRQEIYTPPPSRVKNQFGAAVASLWAAGASGAHSVLVGAPDDAVREMDEAGRVYRFSLP